MWEFSDWSGNRFQREHKNNVRREKKSRGQMLSGSAVIDQLS